MCVYTHTFHIYYYYYYYNSRPYNARGYWRLIPESNARIAEIVFRYAPNDDPDCREPKKYTRHTHDSIQGVPESFVDKQISNKAND